MNRVPLVLLLIGSFARTANSDSLYHKRYINCDYAYEVRIPAGVVVHGNDPPAPNHGFGIDMRSRTTLKDVSYQTSRDWLSADASYNTLDAPWHPLKTPNAVIDDRLDDLRKLDHHPESRIVSRSIVHLGSLRAARVKVIYAGRTEDWTVALRGSVIYELILATDASHYDDDRTILEQLIKGFKLLPLPKGECSNEGAE